MTWKFPGYEIGKLIDWDLLESKYDWFEVMRGVPQDSIWHGEGDVHTHTKMVVEALLSLPEFETLAEQEKHILFASAMLHDVEKRSTTTTEIIDGKERIISPSHAKRGEFTARTFLYKNLPTPFKIREEIVKLVRLHGTPLWAMKREDTRKVVIETSLSVDTKLLYLLSKADVIGRICPDKKELLETVEFFKELCIEHNCFGKSRNFKSNYGRFLFLNREEISPDYEPFDDLKFEVIMLSALPGTGKDFFIKKNFDLPILSLDAIRREHKISPTDKKKNGQVIQIGKEKAKEFMRKRESFIFNATNITSDMRGKWISLFTSYGGKVKIIYLEVPYQKLIAQNHNRDHKVPEKVLEKMIEKLEIPKAREAHEIEVVVES